jgi:hypothetical protein
MPRSLPSKMRSEKYGKVWSIPEFWGLLVPRYESVNYGALQATLLWNPKYAEAIRQISIKRPLNRRLNYLDASEIERVKDKLRTKSEASIRFGAKKEGHGYDGERGDFCLVGGVVKGRKLVLFYRSLELIGGFAYDLTLIESLGSHLETEWDTITVITCKAFVFALRANSNEKLFPKLQRIFHDSPRAR